MKILIIGNSGSGKTWLAGKMAEPAGLSVTHLDELFWEPGGFNRKRPRETVLVLVEQSKAVPSWIVEGVFGELAELYFDQADFLVWLDIEWEICKKRLISRGSESKKHLGREQSEEGLRKLIEWASRYYERGGSCSHAAHGELFHRFKGKKVHVRSVEQIDAVLR